MVLATAVALMAAVTFAAPTVAAAQGQAGAHQWRFQSRAHVDLWFHGLAVVGYEGFGLLPLYDPGYADAVRSLKETRGVAPTPLDVAAPRLLEAFDRDSLFEVLHFVPLYFEHGTVESVLGALDAVALGQEPQALGAEIVVAVITGDARRQVLGEFVAALRAEWSLFFEAVWQEQTDARQVRLEEAQRFWGAVLEPSLAPFLARRGLGGGAVYASAALGAEGRVFAGAPGNQLDNRAAGALPPPPVSDDVMAFALVREVCFPLVSQVVARSRAGHWDRVVAERMSSIGAVRCGAALLDRHVPDQATPYRMAFLRAADVPEASPEDFAAVFPLDPSVEQGIEDALDLDA
jgi:hypothetical protein